MTGSSMGPAPVWRQHIVVADQFCSAVPGGQFLPDRCDRSRLREDREDKFVGLVGSRFVWN